MIRSDYSEADFRTAADGICPGPDLEWFGIDADGHLAGFTNAGFAVGPLPFSVHFRFSIEHLMPCVRFRARAAPSGLRSSLAVLTRGTIGLHMACLHMTGTTAQERPRYPIAKCVGPLYQSTCRSCPPMLWTTLHW
jgi:hypothetical protein